LYAVHCEVAARRDHGRIEPCWFSIHHTESILIDSTIESIRIDLFLAYDICPSVCPSVCLSVWLSVCLSVCPCVCVCLERACIVMIRCTLEGYKQEKKIKFSLVTNDMIMPIFKLRSKADE